LLEERREGFRTVSPLPPPGALARARELLLELAPLPLAIDFDDWASLASICDTGWLLASRRPSPATARIALRRLRALAALPVAFDAFAAHRPGDGPIHLRGTCAPLPGRDASAPVWRLELADRADQGRVLIEEGSDFLLSTEGGGVVYVLSNGGHLVSRPPVRSGDAVSVFGFADAVPDPIGLAAARSGRGGLLPAIRSGTELPLLLTHARGTSASSARREPSREGSGRER
jgi:hypothetical protein